MIEKRLIQIDFDDENLYRIDDNINITDYKFEIIDIPKEIDNKIIIFNEGTITNLVIVNKNNILNSKNLEIVSENKYTRDIFRARKIEILKDRISPKSKYCDSIIYSANFNFRYSSYKTYSLDVIIKCIIKKDKIEFELKCKPENLIDKAKYKIITYFIKNFKLVFDLNAEYYSTEV